MLYIKTLEYNLYKIYGDDTEPFIFSGKAGIFSEGDNITICLWNNHPHFTTKVTSCDCTGKEQNSQKPKLSSNIPIPSGYCFLPHGGEYLDGSETGKGCDCCTVEHKQNYREFKDDYKNFTVNDETFDNVDDCMIALHKILTSPLGNHNHLISDILGLQDFLNKIPRVELRQFKPSLIIDSEAHPEANILYNRQEGIYSIVGNTIHIMVDVEATIEDGENLTEAVRIKLPIKTHKLIKTVYCVKPYIGYSKKQHHLYAIMQDSSDEIEICRPGTDFECGIQKAIWGTDVSNEKVKIILEITAIVE